MVSHGQYLSDGLPDRFVFSIGLLRNLVECETFGPSGKHVSSLKVAPATTEAKAVMLPDIDEALVGNGACVFREDRNEYSLGSVVPKLILTDGINSDPVSLQHKGYTIR